MARRNARTPGSRPGFGWRRTAERMRTLVVPSAPAAPPEEQEEDTETKHALRVLELAMEISDILLSTGASANDVTLTIRKVSRAYGVRGVEADVTFTSISLSWHRHEREPLTTMRVIRTRATDYSRLQRAFDLARGIETGRLDLDEAEKELRSVRRVRPYYRPWVVTASSGALAVGVCTLFAARPIVMVVSFLVSCLVHQALVWLGRMNLPSFFCQAVGAAIPTSATLAFAWLQAKDIPLFDEIQPTIVVAAGIVLLLAGMSTVGAAQDSIDGFYVTASARAFEVVMLTLGIVTGLLLVIRIGTSLGISMLLGVAAPILGSVPHQLVGAVIIAASFAIGSQAGPRTVVLCALMGLIGWIVYLTASRLTLGPAGSSAAGAFVAAVLATLLAPRLKIPTLALITAAIVPLMPGSAVYRGVLLMTEAKASSDAVMGGMMLIGAAGVGLGLAAGTSLGNFIARPISERPRRTRRRA
ncbi:threonine/serine exporter family protein [Mariniluteicoccus flavus]